MIMITTFQDELRKSLGSYLSEKGYDVCVPPHRQDVLTMVKEKNPVLMVLDMYVSDPSGVQVLQELKAHNYQGKLIALAGTSMSHVMPQAMKLGVDQVVGGPQGVGAAISFEQVEAAIRCALHPLIAARAFELYEQRGQSDGNALDDWLEAERQVMKPSSSSAVSTQQATTAGPKKVSKKKKATATKQPSSKQTDKK